MVIQNFFFWYSDLFFVFFYVGRQYSIVYLKGNCFYNKGIFFKSVDDKNYANSKLYRLSSNVRSRRARESQATKLILTATINIKFSNDRGWRHITNDFLFARYSMPICRPTRMVFSFICQCQLVYFDSFLQIC